MEQGSGMLKGTVEADETYVGGKPKRGQGIAGRGTKKTPVVALVERGGNVLAQAIARVTAKKLRVLATRHIDKSSILMTDEFTSYRPVGKLFAGHGVVNHSQGIYHKDDCGVNTAESFFAILKRGHYGIYHHMSKRHLPRYVTEYEFRWNQRKVTDAERREAALRGAEGKRLTYK
jgi:transposase-like protein